MQRKMAFTSLLAYHSYNPTTNTAKIINTLRAFKNGLTADAISKKTGVLSSSTGSCLKSLRDDGVVEFSGEFCKTRSGYFAEVQRLVVSKPFGLLEEHNGVDILSSNGVVGENQALGLE